MNRFSYFLLIAIFSISACKSSGLVKPGDPINVSFQKGADAFEKGKKASFLKLVFAPVVKFTKAYIFQFGFLDGPMGFQVCRVSAYATFLKYKKLR